MKSPRRSPTPKPGRSQTGTSTSGVQATVGAALSAAPALSAAACVALIALLYAPTLQFGFIGFDDTAYVTRHEWVREGLSWSGIQRAFSSDGGIYWHPLTWISHMLDVSAFGLEAGPHHAQNMLWHAGAAVLFLAVARQCGLPVWTALVCTLFWALHPLRVESVAWIAGRKDVLSGFFWLLCLWLYARYAALPGISRYLAMLAAAALAYLAKPSVVTLPFVLLLVDFWPLRRPPQWRLLVEKVPLFVFSIAVSVITFVSQNHAGALRIVRETTLWERAQNALVAYVWYLRQTILPGDLAILYPYPKEIAAGEWIAAAALLLGLTATAIALHRRQPALTVGWLGFLGILVPMIGLIQAGPQPYADRFSYLASIPLILAVGMAVSRTGFSAQPTLRNGGRWLLAGAAVAAIALLAARTQTQVGFWRDGETAFAHAVAVTEGNVVAAVNLGAARIARGAFADALSPSEMAVREAPRSAPARYNLGVVLTQLQRLPEAERELRHATQLDPARAEAWLVLATAQLRMDRRERAVSSLRQALRLGLDPVREAEARNNLAINLTIDGNAAEAEQQFRLALARQPENERTLMNLAVFLNTQGRHAEALEAAGSVLRLNPGNSRAQTLVDALSKPKQIAPIHPE